jgi:hypothetical protein
VVDRKPKVSTRSNPVAPHQPPDYKHFIPTLRQFLEVEDGNHFMGRAGNGSGQEVATLAEWPKSFLLHPEVFICLDGAKEIRTREAALVIIRAIIQAYDPTQAQHNGLDSSNSDNPAQAQCNRSNSSHSEDEESQEADNTKNGLEFSVMATRCYRLLVFLWAISNGMGTETDIDDPSESRITDARMLHTRQELMPSICPAFAQPIPAGGFAGDPATMPALVKNLNAMAKHALRSAKRDEHKTSMIS